MTETSTQNPAVPRSGRVWAFVPAGILVSLLGFQAFLLRGAFSDPSFAIETQYYSKAASWDAKMAQDRENQRLGWTAQVLLRRTAVDGGDVGVTLATRDGSPVTGAAVSVEAFAVARSGTRVRSTLAEKAPGRYVAALPVTRSGMWEVSLDVTRGAEHFTDVTRMEVFASGAAP